MYLFRNKILEKIALTHPSHSLNPEFQRLEFFGDKILSYHISREIMKNLDLNESQLSLYLSNLVNKVTLSKIGAFLIPKIKYKGELQESIIADCLEAWLGAIELDNGNIEDVIRFLWEDKLRNVDDRKNPKNLIQEFAQKKKRKLEYFYEKQRDGDFIATASLGKIFQTGKAKSKKLAAQKAAKILLKKVLYLKPEIILTKNQQAKKNLH